MERSIKVISRIKLGKVGRCIYCGSETTKLKTEHIIPYALIGPWELLEASCGDCEKITSRFETSVIRNLFYELRVGLDFPTRRPELRPKKLPLAVKINGNDELVLLPPGEFPTYLILPELNPPAFIDKRTPTEGIQLPAIRCIRLSGLTNEILNEKYGVQEFKTKCKLEPDLFCRLLAKVAYGFAVSSFGLENIEENYVLPYIRGEKFNGISNWIGGADDSDIIESGNPPHKIQIAISEKKDILVRLKFFAALKETPEYFVVVGRLKSTFPIFVGSKNTQIKL